MYYIIIVFSFKSEKNSDIGSLSKQRFIYVTEVWREVAAGFGSMANDVSAAMCLWGSLSFSSCLLSCDWIIIW